MKLAFLVGSCCILFIVSRPIAANGDCIINSREFAAEFANSVEAQISSIPAQLEYGRLRESEKKDFDFHLEVETLPREQARHFESGWFPTADERLQHGLTFDIMEDDGTNLVIRLGKPETDYIVKYFFGKTNGCYSLKRITNESL